MDSPNLMSMERENICLKSINKERKMDKYMLDQIEYLIQQQFQVSTPALVFEYKPMGNIKEFGGWDYDDLYEFFSHFGEIESLEINGRIALILFRTFMDAYTTREFLMNSSNFKETEKNNFMVRWYGSDDEIFMTDNMKSKIKRNTPSNMIENILLQNNNSHNMTMNSHHQQNNSNNNMSNNCNQNNYYGYFNNSNSYSANSNESTCLSGFNGQYSYYSQWSLNPNARNEFNNVMTNQMGNMNTSNTSNNNNNTSTSKYNNNIESNYYDDSQSFSSEKCLVNGKYTCRFNIQIDNDNEFQVARRLIGAKVSIYI
jgi:hypothetical protein